MFRWNKRRGGVSTRKQATSTGSGQAIRTRRKIRAAIEAMESRLLLSAYTVNTFIDQTDAPGSATVSLRDALALAAGHSGADTINLPAGTYKLTAGPIHITDTGSVTLQAPNGKATLDAQRKSNVMTVDDHATAVVSGLTLTGGENTTGPGGGVTNTGNLTLVNSTISGNISTTSGGGIEDFGPLTLSNCTVSNNIAAVSGAGIDIQSGAVAVFNQVIVSGNGTGMGLPTIPSAAGIQNAGTLTLNDSTIAANAGAFGGGIGNSFSGVLTVNRTTIANNSATATGAGIENTGTVALNNSTLSGNIAGGNGGGIYSSYNSVTLNDSTIADNSAYSGGGIYLGAAATFANSIVAGNQSNAKRPDISASVYITSLGHNLIGRADGSSGWIASDLLGDSSAPVDARLSPLGNFGGPTQTLVPLAGSPALGAGAVALVPSGDTSDQRGLPRTVNGTADIGAVQVQGGPSIHLTAPSSQNAAAGKAASISLGTFTAPSGKQPYFISVDWGDRSTDTTFSLNAVGSLGSRNHTFSAGGPLTVTVAATDKAGDLSNLEAFVVTVPAAPSLALVVNTTKDQTDPAGSKTVSLRDAVNLANAHLGPVAISFDPSVFAKAQTLTLNDTGLDFSNTFGTISVTGPKAGVTIEIFEASAVLTVDPLAHVLLAGLTVTGGSYDLYDGGGIRSQGALTLTHCIVSGCIATDGGGIFNSGDLALVDSSISGDTSIDGNGGGIYNTGRVAITDSTFTGNTASRSYRSFAQNDGSAIYNTGRLTLTGSTFSANTYSNIVVNAGEMTVTNSTFSGNDGGTPFKNIGAASIFDTTIANNTSFYSAGGIDNEEGSSLTLSNSIVAANQDTDDSATDADAIGAITSLGHNLIGRRNSSTGWLASDLTGTDQHPLDPKLSPLDFYGGNTQTQVPLAGSPAISAGSVANVPAGLTIDQRGFARIANGHVDIGAVELEKASVITLTPPAAQSEVAGVSKAINLGSFTDPGGKGPFTVAIRWGDGSSTTFITKSAAGSLGSVNHAFINTGHLTGSIFVIDASGDLASTTFSITSAVAPLKAIVVNTASSSADPAGSTRVSLIDALAIADSSFGPVNITFDPNAFRTAHTINATTAFTGNRFGKITITGPAAGVTLHATTLNRVLAISAGITLSLSHFTLTGGASTDGAGVENAGNLTLIDCTITGNEALGGGGGRGGFYNGSGAGISNSGTLTVTDSTVSDNAEGNEAIANSGQLSLTGSTVSNNDGDGIDNFGILSVTNSTVFGNSLNGVGFSGATTISDSTISGNYAGVSNNSYPGGPALTLTNTIVAGNTSSDVLGKIKSAGHNLIGNADGSSGWIASDLTGSTTAPLDARLTPLGQFGGQTNTLVPLVGSPALGAGSTALIPKGVTTDQRGRPRVINGHVDIGAVEVSPSPQITITPAPAQTVPAGLAFPKSLGSFTAPGGQGPFLVDVDWGDGNPNSIFSLNSPGRFSVPSRMFTHLGTFNASVMITDSAGDLSNVGKFSVTVVPAPVRSIVVNSTADQTDPAGSATITLRDAIALADASFGPVAITFDPTVFAKAQTITFENTTAEFTDNVYGTISVTAPPAGLTLAAQFVHILDVEAGASVSVSGLILSGASSGARIFNSGSLTITGCDLVDSSGVVNDGTVSLFNCTASRNNGFEVGFDNEGAATLIGCTIDANTARDVGGINNNGTLTLGDCIIAQNPAMFGSGGDIAGTVISLGHNLIGNTDGSTGWLPSDLTGTTAKPLDPHLGKLAFNAGSTETFVPLPGSPAIDAGANGLFPADIFTDQRGYPRIFNDTADIGAVETQPTPGFMLVNADSGKVVEALTDGSVLHLASLPAHLTIVADVSGNSIGSVLFGLDGNASFHLETAAPYSLFGDDATGYVSGTFAPGSHTLTARVFASRNGTGTALSTLTVHFST